MVYLFFALKVPILLLAWLVWWAVKAEPALTDDGPEDDGGTKHPPQRVPRPPRPPRPPRRDPHGDPAPSAPARVRTSRAKARASRP